MRSFRIVAAGLVTAIAVALTISGTRAQAATTAQVGKPLPLLAGLRPPHEIKHPANKHTVHVRTAPVTVKKTAAKKTRRHRIAAAHTRRISAAKTAKHEHRARAIAASAFAEEPPAQTAANLEPTRDWPAADATSPPDISAAPGPAIPPSNLDPNPSGTVADGPTVQADAQVNSLDLAAQRDAPPPVPVATSNDGITATPTPAPISQTALAAPAHRQADSTGSASWMAQVLAALGGAAAAGAVAWFLIGGGPVRTYG